MQVDSIRLVKDKETYHALFKVEEHLSIPLAVEGSKVVGPL